MKALLELGLIGFGVAILTSLLLTPVKSGSVKRRVPALIQMLAAVLVLTGAVQVFVTNEVYSWTFNYLNLFAGVTFVMDRLAAFFVGMIALVVIPVSLYSAGYMGEYQGKYSLSYYNFFSSVFIAAMLMVVLAQNLLFFLVAWELMSITSYFLVLFENRKRSAVDAGSLYVIMTHLGALCLMVGFGVLSYYGQSFELGVIRDMVAAIPAGAKNLVFVTLLIAFGSKAGLIPLHVWLPEAHPAAPSNVSALMSGVMLKVAVYGFVRFFFDVTGIATCWWGIVLALLGAVTALIGIIYAVTQKDIKRFLAFSSVENLGIIFATLGVAALLRYFGFAELSSLALAAALFHSLNHAVFKSLLFLGAGNILYSTHRRNLDELGGLVKLLPRTAFWFFLGTAAIAALPPLNGFMSEWGILLAVIQGMREISATGVQITLLLTGTLLALTAGCAMYGFVTLYGIIFSGTPRSDYTAQMQKPAAVMEFALAFLGVLIVGLALGANWFYTLLGSSITLGSMPVVMGALLGVSLLIYLFLKWINPHEVLEIGATWGCGFNNFNGQLQYSAKGFVQPFRKNFHFLLRAEKRKQFVKSAFKKETLTIEHSIVDFFAVYIYEPTIRFVQNMSGWISKIHLGYIQMYILYIMIALVVVLVKVLSY